MFVTDEQHCGHWNFLNICFYLFLLLSTELERYLLASFPVPSRDACLQNFHACDIYEICVLSAAVAL